MTYLIYELRARETNKHVVSLYARPDQCLETQHYSIMSLYRIYLVPLPQGSIISFGTILQYPLRIIRLLPNIQAQSQHAFLYSRSILPARGS